MRRPARLSCRNSIVYLLCTLVNSSKLKSVARSFSAADIKAASNAAEELEYMLLAWRALTWPTLVSDLFYSFGVGC